jgi:hypothetical protein
MSDPPRPRMCLRCLALDVYPVVVETLRPVCVQAVTGQWSDPIRLLHFCRACVEDARWTHDTGGWPEWVKVRGG